MVSASIPGRRAGSTSNASSRTLTTSDAAASAAVPVIPARRSTVTPAGNPWLATVRDGPGSTRTMTSPGPRSRKPLATSRATRSTGESCTGAAQMCGRRPSDANRTRISVRRRSNASTSAAQRSPSSRFQNGSGSTGSWSRMASPRSRSSRPGMAWTRASWRSRCRMVSASTSVAHRVTIARRNHRQRGAVPCGGTDRARWRVACPVSASPWPSSGPPSSSADVRREAARRIRGRRSLPGDDRRGRGQGRDEGLLVRAVGRGRQGRPGHRLHEHRFRVAQRDPRRGWLRDRRRSRPTRPTDSSSTPRGSFRSTAPSTPR